jgi:sigma-B regulation protein RsbU (phosphoserine phosphatase)
MAEPGDMIVLYSDGISDHMNAAGNEYGRSRLGQSVRENCGKPAVETLAAIFKDLDRFSTTAFDDQTVLLMNIR